LDTRTPLGFASFESPDLRFDFAIFYTQPTE
jgi:hypothetical protein